MIEAYGLSDPGPFRKTNEDSFLCDDRLRLFVVADGMGGHSAGEVASRLAVEAIEGFIRRSEDEPDPTWPYGVDARLTLDGNRLRTALLLANRRVFAAAESEDAYAGMGTTAVGVLLSNDRVAIGHVGDSRLYLLLDGALEQVTRDDSWTQTVLAREPGFDPAMLAHHPMRHVLTNVIGAREHTDVHVAERLLVGGELLLLCSDGIHGVLDDDAMRNLLTSEPALPGVARRLVDAALRNGSQDNVTAVVVRYTKA